MPVEARHIYRYPVKGLSAEPLDRVALTAGRALPGDRRFALARAAAGIDPDAPEWQPKGAFLMLMRDERLARLDTRFDAESGRLTIRRDGRQVAQGRITEPLGRGVIADFIAAFLDLRAGETPHLVEAQDRAFSDVPDPVVSLINLASVRELSRVLGTPVDLHRFRGNILVDGAEPWQELDWVERGLRVGGAEFEVVADIGRCAATNVNPATAVRDLNIPKTLLDAFGRNRMGVYAAVARGGAVAVGDPVTTL